MKVLAIKLFRDKRQTWNHLVVTETYLVTGQVCPERERDKKEDIMVRMTDYLNRKKIHDIQLHLNFSKTMNKFFFV